MQRQCYSNMKTVGVKIQIAAGNEKTAEAFSKKLLCGYVQAVCIPYHPAGTAL